MNKKEKMIAVALVGIVLLIVAVNIIKKNAKVPYTINDIYANMEWGMSPEQVKARAIDLGEKWNDNVADMKYQDAYIAEGTNFDGDTYLDYKVIYMFKEDKFYSIYVSVYFEDGAEKDVEKMYQQFVKGFDKKYPRSEVYEWDEEKDYVVWESGRSVMECLKYSGHIMLVYDDAYVRRNE